MFSINWVGNEKDFNSLEEAILYADNTEEGFDVWSIVGNTPVLIMTCMFNNVVGVWISELYA